VILERLGTGLVVVGAGMVVIFWMSFLIIAFQFWVKLMDRLHEWLGL